jgi:Heparinase II/III-like protein/Heparinase II/III N-terminus
VSLVRQARSALRKPPRAVARRLLREAEVEIERGLAPRRARQVERRLVDLLDAPDAAGLLATVRSTPFPAVTEPVDAAAYERLAPGDHARIVEAADRATRGEVRLLGRTFVIDSPASWHTDPGTGTTWPLEYGPRIDYARLGEPCDVKLPWEASRLQWALPLGQAFLLDGSDRWADAARSIIERWLAANPYPRGVNWAIAMEAGLRGIVLGWLLHVFGDTWGEAFSLRVLASIYLHADFVDRNVELGDVNGNHLDADAAALVVLGTMLGGSRHPRRWAERGWQLLVAELPRQVTGDGVDFETATAYHRLVTELFSIVALQRRLLGLDLPAPYSQRLGAMADFAAAYPRVDGSSPLWGDADDARVLPFGPQPLGDHRYLPALVACALGGHAPLDGSPAEICWTDGLESAATCMEMRAPARASRAFRDGGVYVLQGGADHVFVDAAPVGLAGRGGHGHNDCLSFEAMLDGELLVVDCGSFVYTASLEWRNRFRSTEFHNTPQIDGAEINRLGETPWTLHDDARPRVHEWVAGSSTSVLQAGHSGYERLPSPVTPRRTITLDHESHALIVADEFDGTGGHEVRVPLHLHPEVHAEALEDGTWLLHSRDRTFELTFTSPDDWQARLEPAWMSPSYGVKLPTTRIVFARDGRLRPLRVVLAPAGELSDPLGWADEHT